MCLACSFKATHKREALVLIYMWCVCNKKKQEERRRKIDYSWDSNIRNDEPSKKKKRIRRGKKWQHHACQRWNVDGLPENYNGWEIEQVRETSTCLSGVGLCRRRCSFYLSVYSFLFFLLHRHRSVSMVTIDDVQILSIITLFPK